MAPPPCGPPGSRRKNRSTTGAPRARGCCTRSGPNVRSPLGRARRRLPGRPARTPRANRARHRVDLDRPAAAVGRPVESIRFDRKRRAVVRAQVHVRFLARADHAEDVRRETRVEDRVGGPAVAAFAQLDRPVIDSPSDARVERGIVRHSFRFRWVMNGIRKARTRTPVAVTEIKRLPARSGKRTRTSSPGTSWSYGPSPSMELRRINLSGRTSGVEPSRSDGD